MPRRHLRGSGEVSRGRARSPHADEMAMIGPRCQVGHPVSRRETGRWESPFDLGQGILAAPQQNAPSQASPSPRHSHVPPKLNVHEHVALSRRTTDGGRSRRSRAPSAFWFVLSAVHPAEIEA